MRATEEQENEKRSEKMDKTLKTNINRFVRQVVITTVTSVNHLIFKTHAGNSIWCISRGK